MTESRFYSLLKPSTVLTLCLLTLNSFASMRAFLDFKTFYIPGEGPFLETILEFDGSSLEYTEPNEEGLQNANVQITIIIRQGEEVVDFRKLDISSPVKQVDQLPEDFMDMQRFSIPNGKYTLDLELTDLNDDQSESISLEQEVYIEVFPDLPFISDITFVKAYNKADVPTELTKSGYNILPYVNSYFPSDVTKLAFYVELYNADMQFGKDEKYALSYFVLDEEDKIAKGIQRYDRLQAEPATPILKILDITDLPTGDYKLVVEMRDKSNQAVASRLLSFYRNNQVVEQEEAFEPTLDLDVESTFTMRFTDRDTLLEHIESTWPILTNLERNAVQYTLQEADINILRKFFYTVWERRDPDNPSGAWEEYEEQVQKVQEAYGTRVKKGYQTDRGRVYLQYGEPNTIVKRYNDLDAYPYEIWHYYKVGRFNNKRLIFYNPDLVTNDFELLNSDIPGEVRNDRWVLMVLARNNTFGNVGKNTVDNGASRVLIDLWNNPR